MDAILPHRRREVEHSQAKEQAADGSSGEPKEAADFASVIRIGVWPGRAGRSLALGARKQLPANTIAPFGGRPLN
jgi:hypothetical protein